MKYIDYEDENRRLSIKTEKLESVLREAYQITHYGRGSMQDVDDVLERAIRSEITRQKP